MPGELKTATAPRCGETKREPVKNDDLKFRIRLTSYPDIPKSGYNTVQQACRPVLASAVIGKFRWTPGEKFTTQVWILNDSPDKVKSGKLRATLVYGDQKLDLGTWNFDALNANKNCKGPEFSQTHPGWKPGIFKLVLDVEGRKELDSEYILVVGKTKG